MVTCTPGGIGIGMRPILDIQPLLPHVAEHFAADVAPSCLPLGHDPLRGAHDRDPNTAKDTRQSRSLDVDSLTGLADPSEAGDHGLAVPVIAQVNPQGWVPALLEHLIVPDEPLLLEDLGDTLLHLRCRNVHELVPCPGRVPNAREHIGNRICHVHDISPAPSGTTSLTSPPLGAARGAPWPGSRCGRARTCACTRAAVRR